MISTSGNSVSINSLSLRKSFWFALNMIALGLIFFEQAVSEAKGTSYVSIILTATLVASFKGDSILSFLRSRLSPLLSSKFFETKKGER